MSNFFYILAGSADGGQAITVLSNGEVYVASSERDDFFSIVERAKMGDESVIDMFEPAKTVEKKFIRITDRVTVSGGHLLFDNDRVPPSIEASVIRGLRDGTEDWAPLVRFMEKLYSNPNEHSRKQFYRWLETHDFSICADGDVIGYKAVEPETLLSVHSGQAIVDGVLVSGQIPNLPGSLIEMPRSEVTHDPSIGCHVGLHVGTFGYARDFLLEGTVLLIKFSPTDVVSVPTDCSDAKVRVCRYRVIDTTEEKLEPIVWDYASSLDSVHDILGLNSEELLDNLS